MENITTILKGFISSNVPKKATNIFWQMFNGIEASFLNLETRLNIIKRERNMLTAQHITSLRNLAAQNGFEPTLKIPSKGILSISINPKLFNRCGYPVFIPPYSIFTDKISKLTYYYNSDKSFKVDSNNFQIPVIEGTIKTQQQVASTGKLIERFYITDANISNNSITVEVSGVQFLEVKSFFNSVGLNDNKQFVVKFSGNIQTPIIVYVKGANLNDKVNIVYKLTNGAFGNIDAIHQFETQDIIDNYGNQLDISDDEISIKNVSGFDFGSEGSDENTLRSSIGYNHGSILLFDSISYANFLNKYSTVMLQDIKFSDVSKTINNIYCWKKQTIDFSNAGFVDMYKQIILTKAYLLQQEEKLNLTKNIEEFEFCLTSHNIFDANVCNYAFQITLENNTHVVEYSDLLSKLLYTEFGKFLYIKDYVVNIEILFDKFMVDNNIKFEYLIFNQIIEDKKIKEKSNDSTPYIIKNDEYLPILKGDFNICDTTFNTIKLFFDINIVSK